MRDRKAYLRERRIRLRELGMCAECAANPVAEGLRKCVTCTELHRDRARKIREEEKAQRYEIRKPPREVAAEAERIERMMKLAERRRA